MGRRNTINQDLIRSRIRVDESTGCWIWLMYKDRKGYGMIGWNHDGVIKTCRVHRLVWELWNGNIPKGMCVLHKCDNSSCCNPEHLFLGTNLDNIKDAISKGRWTNKLLPGQATEILNDPRSQAQIATDYGLNPATVCRIKKGVHAKLFL